MTVLDERKKLILKAIINEYIRTAEPVGSKYVAEQLGKSCSAATVRNDMAEMEETGFLDKPHISAGRVPSQLGYRLYVNELMQSHRLSPDETLELQNALELRIQELDRLIREAGRILSDLTHCASIAVTPRMTACEILQIDLVACAYMTFVIIVVTSAGIVRNKVQRVRKPLSDEDAENLKRVLNEELSGLEVSEITLLHISRIEQRASGSGELLEAVLSFLREIMQEITVSDIQLDGQTHLLDYPEYRDVNKARRLLEFLDSGLERSGIALPQTDKLDIKIGSENGVDELTDSTVIISSCRLHGNTKAYFALVGPTRMDYARISARMNFFTAGLNKLIREILVDNEAEALLPPGSN